MKRLWEILIGVIAVLVAVGIGIYAMNYWTRNVEVRLLPVPVYDIPPYTLLRDEMFLWKEFPRALQEGYALKLSDLSGKISKSLIPASLPVPMVLAVSSEAFRLAPPKFKVISIPVTPSIAVGGEIHTGQRIDIYRLIPPLTKASLNSTSQEIPAAAELVVQNVLVVDVLGESGATTQGSSSGLTSSFTQGQEVPLRILVLALSPEDTELVLKLVAETKKDAMIWIALSIIT